MSRTRASAPAPLSYALVGAQLVLIALLASPLAALVPDSVHGLAAWLPGALLIVTAGALALAAAVAMRLGNFSVMPEPVAGGALVEHGPYRVVRHPMYAAVLLGGLGACLIHRDVPHWLWLALLSVVLGLKIRREEMLLAARYPGYAEYRRRVKALIPGVL